jgi:hypothetical protein
MTDLMNGKFGVFVMVFMVSTGAYAFFLMLGLAIREPSAVMSTVMWIGALSSLLMIFPSVGQLCGDYAESEPLVHRQRRKLCWLGIPAYLIAAPCSLVAMWQLISLANITVGGAPLDDIRSVPMWLLSIIGSGVIFNIWFAGRALQSSLRAEVVHIEDDISGLDSA